MAEIVVRGAEDLHGRRARATAAADAKVEDDEERWPQCAAQHEAGEVHVFAQENLRKCGLLLQY
jgi:hypothetical protein